MPPRVRTYDEAIRFLFDRIDFERMDPPPSRAFKLDRMRELLACIGNPQERIPAVHIAGTKGKGSTAAMISTALTAAGYRTGLFTSPHLSAFEERMRVGGRMPDREQVVGLVNRILEPVAALDAGPRSDRPTFFEITTAMAWLHFEAEGADVAVLEVGVGGRLDSTNLCRPEVTVITNISRDHTSLLGSTLAEIAREKAGIVKPGVPLVTGVQEGDAAAEIERIACENDASVFRLGREIQVRADRGDSAASVDVETPWDAWTGLKVGLRGRHQADNAAIAAAALDVLRQRKWSISHSAVRAGISGVDWPGRIEVVGVRPTIVLDAAHNWASAGALAETIEGEFAACRRILVLAATRDKDVAGLLRQLLPRFDSVILTQYRTNPRAVPAAQLQRLARAASGRPMHIIEDPEGAFEAARAIAGPDDLICVAGSFFIVAEVRARLLATARAQESPPSTERADAERRPEAIVG